MSDLRERQDIQDYLAYQQLNNFVRALHNNPDHPSREPFFTAMAQGRGVRVGGYEFEYSDLIQVFLRGAIHEVDECADEVARDILDEANAVTLDWNGKFEVMAE